MNLKLIIASVGLIFLTGCFTLISNFDPISYSNASDLKLKSLALMDVATEPYANHQESILDLKARLSTAVAYEHGRSHNKVSALQWDVMASDERELLGSFLKEWEEGWVFSHEFIDEKKKQIGDSFDQIISLESSKNR